MTLPDAAATARRSRNDAAPLAPGARVVIRDEEWIVRSTKKASWGGNAVQVVGTSELVRGQEWIFLSDLESIQELRPEETAFVHDDSPWYRRSRLYLECLHRRTPATDDRILTGHRAAINPVPYQMQPASKALRQPRPRILMADGVGLGKTIEVGILLSELIQRGRGERILVVALKSILEQFQQELWARFTIPLVRLDSVGIQRMQARIPSNQNPFYTYDKVIVSIDTLKRDAKYRRYLEDCRWDVVVVDECQNVAVRGSGGVSQQSQRARLARLLARTSDGLVLTSATPHDGRPESFASLINLLEPTAVADESNFTHEEIDDYYLRRFKRDIAHEVEARLPERPPPRASRVEATPAESEVFDRIAGLTFKTIARSRGGKGVLFRTTLLKAFLSSPRACLATVEARLAHRDVRREDDLDAAWDREVLEDLKRLLERLPTRKTAKVGRLLEILRAIGIGDGPRRVVVFSERIDTLRALEEILGKELGLADDQVEIFHGSLDDQRQQHLVQSFGTKDSPVRVLLASDVASEGINLHYFCHHLVHFDLPWSLITLEQRNGRIDRFGQTEPPEIHYLLTVPADEKLRGDLRVLDRLVEKEDHAHRNLGDVAWLMNLHSAEEEEDRIGRGIEEGLAPEEVVPDESPTIDFLALLAGDDDAGDEPAAVTAEPFRFYAGDLGYVKEALAEAVPEQAEHVDWFDDHIDGFLLRPPADLRRRFELLPPELRTASELKLTVDRQLVMDSLAEAREESERWPEWQLYWEQHPVAEWLDDRVLARFARHEAPVLRLQKGLEPGDRLLVFQGIVSNRRSQPVIVEWVALRYRDGRFADLRPFREIATAGGLLAPLPNPGRDISPALRAELERCRGPAVELATNHFQERRLRRSEEVGPALRRSLRDLREWKSRRTEMTAKLPSRKQAERERHEIEAAYAQRKQWIDDTLRTVPEPFLRLAAALVSASDPLDAGRDGEGS